MDPYFIPLITNQAFRIQRPSPQRKEAMLREYDDNGCQSIFQYAKERKILPFLAKACIDLGRDVDFWTEIIENYRQRNMNIIAQLDKVFGAFKQASVRKVFLSENFGALLSSGHDISLFCSGDIDIYADICEKERIYEALRQLGYVNKERHTGKKLITTVFYQDALYGEHFGIDVNWDPLSRIKLPCMIKADDFVDWEQLYAYANTYIMLPPVESLMYICLLHISLHSFSRAPDIRLYTDVQNCAALDVDWDKLLGYAAKDRTMIRILTALSITHRLFCLPLPASIEEKLKDNVSKVRKVMKYVYAADREQLLYEPNKLTVLRIETYCYDQGWGLIRVLFPGKEWLTEAYLSENGSYLAAEMRHLRRLF